MWMALGLPLRHAMNGAALEEKEFQSRIKEKSREGELRVAEEGEGGSACRRFHSQSHTHTNSATFFL